MVGTAYLFNVPTEDVSNYLIEYTPPPFGTTVKVSLTTIDSSTEGGGAEETFGVCSSTVPVFYLESNPNDPITPPFSVEVEGDCGGTPEPEPESTYTLSLVVNPDLSGTATDSTNTAPYLEGEFVTVQASPSAGFIFVNWTEGSTVLSNTQTYSFSMPARNLTLTANFVSEEPTPPPPPVPPLPPTNYDTNCQRFVLIRNANQLILPEDIIDLNLFNDKFYLPDEPEGFDTATLTLSRDEDTHGFNYEYSLDLLSFTCEYGKQYLRTVHEEDGTDADVKFIYGVGVEEEFSILYIGRLDFNEYAMENAEYVKLNLRKDDFGSILQTAFEIPQEVVPSAEVLLYSKVIPRKITYTIPQPDQTLEGETSYPIAYKDISTGRLIGKESPEQYILVNDGKEGDVDAQIFPTYDFQVDPNDPPSEGAGLKYLFRAKEAGLYKITVKFTTRFNVSSIEGFGNITQPDIVDLVYLTTESDGITPKGSRVNIPPTAITSFNPFGRDAGGHVEFEFDQVIEEFVNVEECFYLFFKILTGNIPQLTAIGREGVEARPFRGDINQPQIIIVAETLAPASISKFISPIDAFNLTFQQASEVTYDLVKSTFFTEGCGKNLFMTNGFNVRGFTEDSRNILKLSPQSIFNYYKPIFNLGWGVEYDGFRNELVRVEPVEYFYQDVKLLDLDSDLISDYEVIVDSTKYYNEIEVGFRKYSKERETDKGNTLDDFHTKHTYQTPIKTNKQKLSVISDITLSGYELEILRRKQFKKDGNNENANFREDEDIFGVQLLNQNLYSGASYNGILTDLSSGDIMYVTNNSIIVVDYAYFYQGQQVAVKVDDNTPKQNSILNIEYGFFVPVGFPFEVQGTKIVFNNALDTSNAPFNITVQITTLNGEAYLVPESNQPFESVQNLISPQSAYNLRYSPKRMLINWSKLYNGGFRTKQDAEEIVFKQGDGNINLLTRFNSVESCRLGDDKRLSIVEKDNIKLSDTFSRQSLFLPYKVSFSYPLSFEELNYLRRAMRGISVDDNNYGFIEYINPLGNIEKIFITKIEFTPTQEEAIIEGYLKDFSI